MNIPPAVERLTRGHKQRFLRYAGVSAIAVPLGQLLLQIFLQVLSWHAVAANVAAVTITAVPSYLLNRHWVWQKSGKNHFMREVLPFWGMALAGLALSTVFVWLVSQWTSSAVWIGLANLSAFGVLWVVKYAVLHSYIFTHHDHYDTAPSGAPAAGVR